MEIVLEKAFCFIEYAGSECVCEMLGQLEDPQADLPPLPLLALLPVLPGEKCFALAQKFLAWESPAAAAKSLQSCPTLCDPRDSSPPGSPYPWDSPGKNTGVGCHFLLQYMTVKSKSEVAQSCPTPSDPMDCMQPTSLLCPWDFPGKSTGVKCHCLLHGSPLGLPN